MQTGREPSRGSALAAPRTPAVVPTRPARPTLTLKGKVPAPPQQVVPERPAVDTAAASSPRVEPIEVVPAPKPAPGAPAAATDAPAKSARPFRPWRGAGCRALRVPLSLPGPRPSTPSSSPRSASSGGGGRSHAPLPGRSRPRDPRPPPARGGGQCLREGDPRLCPQLQLPARGRPARIDALRPRRQPGRAGEREGSARHAAQLRGRPGEDPAAQSCCCCARSGCGCRRRRGGCSCRRCSIVGFIRNPEDHFRISYHQPARRVSEADFRIAKRSVGNRITGRLRSRGASPSGRALLAACGSSPNPLRGFGPPGDGRLTRHKEACGQVC